MRRGRGRGGSRGCPPPPAPLLLSSPVLAAEVVKFFFPAMVQLHSYVPASSTPQKLANWGHLNRYRGGPPSPPNPGGHGQGCCGDPDPPGCSSSRKVLSKLSCCVPDEVLRQVVRCRPGAVEQVFLLLRQKIEEKQEQSMVVPSPGQVSGAWGEREGTRRAASCSGCHVLRGRRVGRASGHPTAWST